MLTRYFACDDGSLPEIEVVFAQAGAVIPAFGRLFELGANDVTRPSARVWQKALDVERAFEGPVDATRVVAGEIDPFHLVLADIHLDAVALPDLGVLVRPNALTLDYRMGGHWGEVEVSSLIRLLRLLQDAGATIRVPWWGSQAEEAFLSAIGSA